MLEKKATLKQLIKSWTVSWTGNLVGSVLLAAMVATAGTLGAYTPFATLRPAPPQPRCDPHALPRCGLHPLSHTAPRTTLHPASTMPHTPTKLRLPHQALHTPH